MIPPPRRTRLQTLTLVGGPVLGVAVAAVAHAGGLSLPASLCAWVAVVCAVWWIFESLHLAVVGLFPFAALPMLGILDHKRVAASYGHTMILLLLGGFLLSAAMERSGAHRRIALTLVRAVGGRGGRFVVLGFMIATASLSMWISNAATTLMMLPIAMAVLTAAGEHRDRLRTPLLLGIAYAASVGGMATPIGTPPNVVFMGFIEETYQREITFARWMTFGLPITLAMLPLIWIWVTRRIGDLPAVAMPPVGPWRSAEVRVLVVFAVTAGLWMTRTGPGGGWSAMLGSFAPTLADSIGDTTVALAACMALFMMPAGSELDVAPELEATEEGRSGNVDAAAPLLDWPTAARIPWGILIMFGGGLALADAFKATGLSTSIGGALSFVAAAPPLVTIAAVCLLMNFLTEMTSSTATATLMMPILGSLADATGMPPEAVLIPGTISASCAFMLPVATAPNTIVFGAGEIGTGEMARTGFVLNLVAAAVVIGVCGWRF